MVRIFFIHEKSLHAEEVEIIVWVNILQYDDLF